MEQKLTWSRNTAGTDFFYNGEHIGTACAESGCQDRFLPLEEGVIRWERTYPSPASCAQMRFEADYRMRYQMSPAVMYNENQSDEIIDYGDLRRISTNRSMEDAPDPNFFRGCIDAKTGIPWKLAWWHMSVPGATYTEGETQSAAMFLPPDQLDACTSVYPCEGQTIHEMRWPLEEGPRIPVMNMHGREPASTPENKAPGEVEWIDGYSCLIAPRTTFAVVLVFEPVEYPRFSWHKLMDTAWRIYRKDVPPKFSEQELWDLGIAYAQSLYDEETDGFCSTAFGKIWIDGQWRNRPYFSYELGWCGQSASIAASLLVHAIKTGDQKAAEMGIRSLDSWISRMLPSGLLPTHIKGQEFTYKERRIVDACNLAGGAINLFDAFRYAQALGISRPEYFKAACNICDFAVNKIQENGKIGKSWAEDDLSPIVENGTTGAFLTMALCEGAANTGKQEYLDCAIQSYRYYYNEFIEQGYTMGGAQDCFSIDKESCIPLLKAGLRLYELTGEGKYLDCAENAAWYLSTWQWHFTREFPAGSSLQLAGYDTFGGTTVSIHGAGQDPYALYYVNDLYDLADYTGNEMWAERAHAAWRNGHDGVSDGTLVVNGRPIPAGGQHEARAIGREGEEDVYEWLVAWPTAFRLENLRRTSFPMGDRAGRKL